MLVLERGRLGVAAYASDRFVQVTAEHQVGLPLRQRLLARLSGFADGAIRVARPMNGPTP